MKRRDRIQRELERHGKFLDRTKIEIQLSKQKWSEQAVLKMYMKQFGLNRRPQKVKRMKPAPKQPASQPPAPQLKESTPLPAPAVDMAKGMSDISSFMASPPPSQRNQTGKQGNAKVDNFEEEVQAKGSPKSDFSSPAMQKVRSEAKSPQE
eukprot:UN25325